MIHIYSDINGNILGIMNEEVPFEKNLISISNGFFEKIFDKETNLELYQDILQFTSFYNYDGVELKKNGVNISINPPLNRLLILREKAKELFDEIGEKMEAGFLIDRSIVVLSVERFNIIQNKLGNIIDWLDALQNHLVNFSNTADLKTRVGNLPNIPKLPDISKEDAFQKVRNNADVE